MVKKQKENKLQVSTSTFIILSLLVGIIIGFSIGSSPSLEQHSISDMEDEDHDHSTHTHEIHSHDKLEIISEKLPTLDIEVIEDEKLGYNLELKTTNFDFVSTSNYEVHTLSSSNTSGHAHLYINGEKITRLYSNSYYLGELEGDNEITVTLNSNNHEDYTINGEVIQSTLIIE